MAIRKAARLCGIPPQSLRDKVTGKTKIGRKSGPPTIFTSSEESLLRDHILFLAKVGYPLSRREVISLANNSAVLLQKRGSNSKVGKRWFEGFLKRWPELKIGRPQKLSLKRAKASSEEIVNNYFKELDLIMTKYNLKEKPQLIFNIDETGFQVEHSPPKCVGPSDGKLNSITTDKGAITTVIAAGNALGNTVPPYFVFKGKKMFESLKDGALPGSTFTLTESGWSNGEVFKDYVQNHLIKFLPNRNADEHVLLLYDGHNSHISVPLIEFALENKIVLFVLPPHTSHILQPLDVAVFKPLKTHFHNECHKLMRKTPGEVITRYHITRLISTAYMKAFTPENLTSSFRKTGIFPLNKNAVKTENFMPAENLRTPQTLNTSRDYSSNCIDGAESSLATFLLQQRPRPSTSATTKPKRKVQYRPGGVAITEEKILLKIRKVYDKPEEVPIPKTNTKREAGNCDALKSQDHESTSKPSHLPSTSTSSGSVANSKNQSKREEESEEEIEGDDDKCCVCEQFSPPGLSSVLRTSVKFIEWAECTSCTHWVHLEFCVTEKQADIGEFFHCPHCKDIPLEE